MVKKLLKTSTVKMRDRIMGHMPLKIRRPLSPIRILSGVGILKSEMDKREWIGQDSFTAEDGVQV